MAEAETGRNVLPLVALAEALGRPKGSLSRWSRQPWFPRQVEPGRWDVEAVRAALGRHAKGPAPKTRESAGRVVRPLVAAHPEPSGRSPEPSGRSLVDLGGWTALEDEGSSPVEMARAGVRLAARMLLDAHAKGEAMPRDLDALKKTLEELRRSEAGYLDLAKRRGELVERSEAAAVAARIARQLVELLGNVEARLGSQVAIWMADPAMARAGAEEQGRVVRGWFAGQVRSLRSLGAREIEAMIEEEREA